MEPLQKITAIRELINSFSYTPDEGMENTRNFEDALRGFLMLKGHVLALLTDAEGVWNGVYGSNKDYNKGLVSKAAQSSPMHTEPKSEDMHDMRMSYLAYLGEIARNFGGLTTAAMKPPWNRGAILTTLSC